MTKQTEEMNKFDNVVSTYDKQINSVISRYEANKQECEDIKQEIYIKIFAKAFKFEAGFSPRGWIKTVTENYCKNHLRNKSRYSFFNPYNSEDGVNLIETIPDENAEVKSIIDQEYTQKLIYNAVQNLKPKYRDVIELFDFEEKTYEQISEELKCPVGTVKSRLFNARLMLKEQLKDLL